MSTRTFQYEKIKAPKAERGQSLDDWWFEGEMEAVKREQEKKNGDCLPQRFCDCRELLTESGERLPCPPQHSCEYTRERSKLVPVAAALANAEIGNDAANGDSWTRRFNAEMDRLAEPLLRQSSNGAHEQETV